LQYLARSTLFRSRPFAALIRRLGAVPVEREGVGIGGTRAVLSILAGGGAVVMFPEGTRSRDGSLGPLRPGAVRIAQRSGAQVVPVWIAGSGDAMPPGALFPRPRRIEVRLGAAFRIPAGLAAGAAIADLRERLLALAGPLDETMTPRPEGIPSPRE
jgi:1-acyl-sn-glycerol-3-phosphate acyltransferase